MNSSEEVVSRGETFEGREAAPEKASESPMKYHLLTPDVSTGGVEMGWL